jgi:hypothetical protein
VILATAVPPAAATNGIVTGRTVRSPIDWALRAATAPESPRGATLRGADLTEGDDAQDRPGGTILQLVGPA